MHPHLKRTLCLAAAALGVSATTGVAAASAANIKETGSSLVLPLVADWAQHYSPAMLVSSGGGSVVGISAAANPGTSGIDIGASDAPETPSQYQSNDGVVTELPWALSATGIAYDVPGVGEGLKLNAAILAGIYTGKITSWSNSAIVEANPNYAKALKQGGKITPLFRADGSGDTYAFEHFLTAAAAKTWTRGYSTAWAGTVGTGETGNSGLVGAVRKIRGSIAYLAAYYLITQKIDAAKVQNAAGNYEFPNPQNIASAAASGPAKLPAQGPSFTGLSIVNPPRKYAIAYPISTYTYALVNAKDGNLGAVKSFLTWATSTGQRYGATLDFVTLPAAVRKADAALISAL